MSVKEIINRPGIRDFIDSIPADSRLSRTLRLWAKAIVFRKKIYKGWRLHWPGVEDTILEKYAFLGPGPDEVLVKTEFTAISSGTEWRYYIDADEFIFEFPYTPGYSGSGTVVAVGKGVDDFIPGDRVAGVMKHSDINIVPAASLARIPRDLPADLASIITLGVITLSSLREADIQPGAEVAVIGQGVIGQLILSLCKAAGAGKVIAVARTESKRGLSLQTGADTFVSTDNNPEELAEISADLVFEASGFPAALVTSIDICKPGGRIILAGSSTKEYAGQDFKERLIAKKITAVGAHVRNLPLDSQVFGSYRREAETFLNLLNRRKLKVEHLFSSRLRPEEVPEFYQQLARGESPAISPLIDWREETRSPVTLLPAGLRREPDVSRSDMGEKTFRFALAGCGAIAGLNARAVRAATGSEIAVIMDVNEDSVRKLAREHSVPYLTDFDAILSDDSVDVVFIAVPHHLHCELTIRAAEAGKHVLVEKPIALDVSEAKRMIAACRSNDVALSVCYPMRYSSAIITAKKFIREGGLGELFGTQTVMLRDRSEYFSAHNTWYETSTTWRGDKSKSGGGILMDNIPHYLDYYRYLTGLEVEAVAGLHSTRILPVDVEDTAAVICRYTNGAQGIITVSSVVRGSGSEENPSINNTTQNLWGAEGQILLYPQLQLFSRRRVGGCSPNHWQKTRLKPSAGLKARTTFIERFCRALSRNEAPEVSGEDGLQNLAIIQAAYLAGRENRWVTIEEVLAGDE